MEGYTMCLKLFVIVQNNKQEVRKRLSWVFSLKKKFFFIESQAINLPQKPTGPTDSTEVCMYGVCLLSSLNLSLLSLVLLACAFRACAGLRQCAHGASVPH